MTEPDHGLIQEIRRRLSELPKEAVIDSLAMATALGSGYSSKVEEIRDLVNGEADAAGVICSDRN